LAENKLADDIRYFVRDFIVHCGPSDLDRDLIPYLSMDRSQPIVRGYLLQTLMQAGRGFVVKHDGRRTTVDICEPEPNSNVRRKRRPPRRK